jgi:hypothetical protein
MKVEHWLFENALPPVLWGGTSFRVVPERVDTMGQKTVHVSLSDVGSLLYWSPDSSLKTVSVVNQIGEYYFSKSLSYPVAGSAAQIANLTLEFRSGKKVKGRQVMTMYFQVIEPELKKK